MSLIPREEANRGIAGDFHWWKNLGYSELATADLIDVPVASLLDTPWCSIHRVSVGAKPHSARFRRSQHTFMIFDRGSFVDGERHVSGLRSATSSPLDRGIDVVPANTEFHALARQGSNIGCILVSVKDDHGQADSETTPTRSPLHPSLGLTGHLLFPLSDRLRQLCSGSDGEPVDPLYLETLVEMLAVEVRYAQNDVSASSSRCSGGLSSRARNIIREFVSENLDQKIDLATLAERVGLSRFHFTRAFKTSFGVPPYKYLLNLRIRKASDLLKSSRTPITTIALEVGFSCPSEFARAFKQIMDCTPREYRLLNR
ncbi:helix-turn-helix transcriptional regulator [Cupriavidus basilensis]|uniref:helix-turn-helix transcriptional regulator n=1 Tax=Cupriavidus basilensis TaxID=68895 RepID=UPI0009E567CF|nr:AraC family transcriptional regulator [Cupriavidus basilensis]